MRLQFDYFWVAFTVIFAMTIATAGYNLFDSTRQLDTCRAHGGTALTGPMGVFEGCIYGGAPVGVVITK